MRVPVGLVDRCRFPDDAAGPLALGVSGGADSAAMAYLAAEAGRSFEIWHVDHGLRATSADDAARVEHLAGSLGVRCTVRRVDVASGPGLEARCRRARYDALPDHVCVAHTADDRAETVLANLFRGAGPTGVAAPMARVHRPLLELRRHETAAVCSAVGYEPVVDVHNDDPSFTRVRVRHELLPLAEAIFGRDPVPLLVRHADQVAAMLRMVQDEAATVDVTDAAAVRAADPAVAAEAIRGWLRSETGAEHPVDAASVARVLAVAAGDVRAAEVVGGHRVARSRGRLSISRADGGAC